MNIPTSSPLATVPASIMSLLAGATAVFAGSGELPADDATAARNMTVYLNAGYASSYVFRGMNLGDNWAEARAELAMPLGETTSLSVGGKYGVADGYDEAQGFLSVQQSLGVFTGALGYRWYGLDADEHQEIGALIGTSLLGIDWNLGYYYDTGVSGQFVEFTGQRTWQLMDRLAFRTTAGISYSDEYWLDNSGFNNAIFRLDLPFTVRDWCTLTPWISASIPLDAIDNVADDEVFGGVNLQLSF